MRAGRVVWRDAVEMSVVLLLLLLLGAAAAVVVKRKRVRARRVAVGIVGDLVVGFDWFGELFDLR